MRKHNPANSRFFSLYEDTTKSGYTFRAAGEFICFFSGINDGTLRKALRCRNDFYQENHHLPEGLYLRPLEAKNTSARSITGFNNIFAKVKKNSDQYQLVIKVRNLTTRTVQEVKMAVIGDNYRDASCLNPAILLRDLNLVQYNQLVLAYNEAMFKRGMILARKELKLLKPQMYEQNKFDRALWEKGLKKLFPAGLESFYCAK